MPLLMIPPMHPLQKATSEAWDSVENTIAGLTADDWDRPTPCTGWSVKDVLAHLGHMEGLLVHGFDQPDPPSHWMPEGTPLDQVTGHGVVSRRAWAPPIVADEIHRAAAATRQLLARPDLDWEEETPTPIGPAPRHVGAEMRVTDVVLHLCDVRTALGLPLDGGREPAAIETAVARAVRLTPWAWAKRVAAANGQSLRLTLKGRGATECDVVMANGRAAIVPASNRQTSGASGFGRPVAEIEGNTLAYLLAASGRHGQAASAGGLVARGEPARLLLEKFRIVG